MSILSQTNQESAKFNEDSVKLYAISDLHIANEKNWLKIQGLSPKPKDWIVLAGDLCEKLEDFARCLEFFSARFAKVVWVPGNHELWTVEKENPLKGEDRYFAFVEMAKRYHTLTPEDPYTEFSSGSEKFTLVPMFLLYDYTFRPDSVSDAEAISWAEAAGVLCADEYYLNFNPHVSRKAWSAARVAQTYQRLCAIPREKKLILINHFQLRYDLVTLPKVPRFSLWCGTKKTENWHKEFNVAAVISGHLHLRSTHWRDGVRFEEVSLGNPNQYKEHKPIDEYLRQIVPYSGPTEQVDRWGPW
jgi:3',5'-cyclic AMP phosphodiesterase CpdA